MGSMEESMPISQCFSEGQQATVFHVHEVMRLALQTVSLNSDGKEPTFHTISAQDRFSLLSYHASNVWQNWSEAFGKAGDSEQAILQSIFGVRIHSSRWIPHRYRRFIIVGDEEWAIIDDIIPSSDYIDNFGMENLWFSADTGLRLIRTSKIPTDSEQFSFGELMGETQRFPSASSWLQWCADNGTPRDELPSLHGNAWYFKGIDGTGGVPRYSLNERSPPPSEFWSFAGPQDPDVPYFRINGKSWCFGCLWKQDEEDDYWHVTWPHLLSKEGDIIVIGRAGLGIDVIANDDQDEDDILLSANAVWNTLTRELRNMHLRAIRILLIEAGLASNPNPEDPNVWKLMLRGSPVESPYSDLFYIRPPNNYGKPVGVVIGSPIENAVRRSILKMNWYGV